MVFLDSDAYNRKVVQVGQGYADAGVSRATSASQVCNFLEFAGQQRDPSISFCAAFGGYIRAHAYCDMSAIKYDSSNVVRVFKSVIPYIEQNDIKISASCEEVRQWAITHKKFFTTDSMGDALKFKPGWVLLFNYEDDTDHAHHYATVISPISSSTVRTIEGNTSSWNQANGGAVAVKVRDITSDRYRGVVVTY